MECVINYSVSSWPKRRAFFLVGFLFRNCRIISSRESYEEFAIPLFDSYLCGIYLVVRRRRLVPGVGVCGLEHFLCSPKISVFLLSEGLPFFRRIIPHKAVNAKMAVRYAISITLPTLPCPENPTNCFPAPTFNVGKIANGFADRDQARDRSTLNARHDKKKMRGRRLTDKLIESWRKQDFRTKICFFYSII